jgi:hypothetical protein
LAILALMVSTPLEKAFMAVTPDWIEAEIGINFKFRV